MNHKVHNIFSTPLFSHKNFIPQEYFFEIEQEVKNAEYEPLHNGKDKVFMSTSKNFLKKLPSLKKKITETFKEYAYNTLSIDQSVEFVVGSSWSTMTSPNGESTEHTHANYYYSGCYYITENPSPINFFLGPYIYNYHERFLFNYKRLNQYNSNKISYVPEKNELIFFPSYVKHQIEKNESDKNRYSIAFNFHPSGIYGREDSSIHVQVIDDLD